MTTETPTCACGHVQDEHDPAKYGFGACTIEGCHCFLYEEDPDA